MVVIDIDYPKDCNECPFLDDYNVCIILDKYVRDECGERLPDCPIKGQVCFEDIKEYIDAESSNSKR